MDDCNLEKLGIKASKISPAFKQDVLEYNATVPSSTAEVTLDLLTRDSGASYTISVCLLDSMSIVFIRNSHPFNLVLKCRLFSKTWIPIFSFII